MFDELDYYLGSITTPENQRLLIRSCELLNQAGILSHESDIEQILRTADNHTTEDNLLDLFSLLTEYLINTIEKFGLSVEDSVPIKALNHILDSLLILPNYGDPEAVLGAIEDETDVEERVCDIFSIVSSLRWHDFAPYITSVDEALLPRIASVTEQNIPPEEPGEDISFYRERVQRLREHNPDAFAHQIVREGFRLGTPLNTLIGRFHDDLDAAEAKADELAEKLLNIIYVSNTPSASVLSCGEELLEDYAKDINVTTKAHTAFLRLLKEVNDA
tara:strand:+ start:3209 stop:4033 length:825 start_codon:yes stop_codon:yes gene_type:complete